MIDLTNFSVESLKEIAIKVEKETDLAIFATKRYLPLYDGKITSELIDKSFSLLQESKRVAEEEGLEVDEEYQFRENYIKNYKIATPA